MRDRRRMDDVASLTEHAYQAISDAIVRLELKPGEALTQDRLAHWLAISRTPVREALRRLEQEGIIQMVAGHGLVVTELTLQNVEDMLELLRLLDTHAAHTAALRRTDEQAARLLATAQQLLAAAEGHDMAAWSAIDRPYHETLLEATNNQYLRGAILDLRRRLRRVTYNVALEGGFLLSGTHEHLAIAQAIANGNAALAAQAMQQHLDAVAGKATTLIRTYIIPIRGERF